MIELARELFEAHPLAAPLGFILLRAVPVIVAPIPGVAFDLLGIALFGWKLGLVLALVGGHLGAITAFYIARRYREAVVRYVAPLRTLHRLEDHYSERQKFLILIAVRFITSPVFDYVNYAAGLTKMRFRNYLLSTFIGVLPYSCAIYYFGEQLLKQGWLYAILATTGLIILAALSRERLLVFLGRFSPRRSTETH